MIVFFDTETTGTDPTRHVIIQLAAIAVDADYQEVDSFERKLAFDETAADPEALEMNSFDAKIWAEEQLDPGQAFQQFSEWLRPYCVLERISRAGNPYQVAQPAGHNIAVFDLEFLRRGFKHFGAFLPMAFFGLDTLQLAVWLQAHGAIDVPNLRLPTLAEHFGVSYEAHDALEDVRANAEVARLMTRYIDRGIS